MESNPNGIYALIVIATAIITLIGNYFVKKSDNTSSVKIAEINADKKEFENTKKELQKALVSIRELKQELLKETEIKLRIEKKFQAVQVAYRIIFKQYAKQFKDDPDSLVMLEELNNIINN